MDLKPMVAKILGEGTALRDAVTFYTIIPLPLQWQGDFIRVAHWSPWIGGAIGGLLAIFGGVLRVLQVPDLVGAVAVGMAWVGITGGLHLDGAMDTADGLAVGDAKRRLAVMQDSRTGAFGVMVAIAILGLKIAALSEGGSGWGLVLAAGWGRWGQVAAIAFYPYLKPQGKGAFHRQGMRLPMDLIWAGIGVLLLEGGYAWLGAGGWQGVIVTVMLGNAIALGMGYGLYRYLGGHTGDSYGAVVEWTEALFLCGFVSWLNWSAPAIESVLR